VLGVCVCVTPHRAVDLVCAKESTVLVGLPAYILGRGESWDIFE
jgi:hypothetical protein